MARRAPAWFHDCRPALALRLTHWLLALCAVGISASNLGCRLVTQPLAERRPSADAKDPDAAEPGSMESESNSGSESGSATPVAKRPLLERKTIAAILASSSSKQTSNQPSNNRNWRPDLAVLPVADIRGDLIRLYHIRDCDYRTEEDYDVRLLDRQFALTDVRTMDFIVVPFQGTPALAHTMLSFGLANGEHYVVSVEGRLEQGEKYSTLGGAMNGYELMVVIGTERDLILLRTEVRKVDVYLYPTRVTPEQAQRVFVAMLGRANQLAKKPEFYDLLTNNCTTNIVDHINALKPGSIPNDLRVVLPGHSDRMAYDLGLLAVDGPFDQIKAACHVNLAAHLNYDADAKEFSARIRQR